MDIEEFKEKLNSYGFWYGDEFMLEFQEELLNVCQSQQDEIKCLTHNIEVHKEREQVGIRRLEKVVKYLEELGLSASEINNIMKLEEENF